MRTSALLGIALLCVSQVSSDKDDLLHSLFNEKVKQLNSEKLQEPEVFLAADPTPTSYECNANELVANGTTLVKNTVNIFSESFSVVYTTLYSGSATEGCSFGDSLFGKFRCFIWEFNTAKNSIKDVTKLVTNYQSNAADLLSGIKMYFSSCMKK